MDIDGIPDDADDFAAQILAALNSPGAHVSRRPLVDDANGDRDVLIDGRFDLVAAARHLADALRRDLAELRSAARELGN